MRPRLTIAALGVASALAVAACGSSSSPGSSAPAPLSTALSYFPSNTALVATIATDPGNTAFQNLEANTPDATVIKAGLFQELAKLGIDYNRDMKPLLGNPIAFGIGSQDASGNHTSFLAAWQTDSASALKRLVAKLKGIHPTGRHDGATLYTVQGSGAVAVTGATMVISNDPDKLTEALDRHAAKSGLSSAQYAQDTNGLPTDGVLTAVGDLGHELARPSSTQARRVPWVAAIKGYGLTLGAEQKSAQLHFRLDTSGRTLTPAQLPIAAGAGAPLLASNLPIRFSIHDPGHVFQFAKSASQAASPHEYRKITSGEARIKQRLGVDFEQLAGSLTGDLQVASDEHAVFARIPVSASEVASIDKILQHPTAGKLTNNGTTSRSLGGGLYVIQDPSDPTNPVVAGVVDHQLVIGEKATANQVRAFARAPSTKPSGAGAVAFTFDISKLLKLALQSQPNPIIRQFAGKLGQLTGSLQATPSALTGTATITQR